MILYEASSSALLCLVKRADSMSARSQRGRSVRTKQRNNLRGFYIILAIIAIAGIAVIATFALGGADRGAVETGDLESFPSKGNPDAPVTVIEYSDYQCPACASYAQSLHQQIDRQYIETGQIYYVFHDFPLRQHQNAIPAAEAARCAGDQDKYWEMHDLLFFNQDQWASEPQPAPIFASYASQLELDREAFDACLTNGAHRQAVLNARQAAEAAGIAATPTFVINGQQFNALQLQEEIEDALAASR